MNEGAGNIIVLGLGNMLLRDDGVGIHVVRKLASNPTADFSLQDGGTIGLALLNDLAGATGVIAVDAAAMGEKPGTVKVFTGEAMDRQLSGFKTSAHEVALADLMAAAALTGALPEHRALVGIEPESIAWGLDPTAAVAAAIPKACEEIVTLGALWRAAAAGAPPGSGPAIGELEDAQHV